MFTAAQLKDYKYELCFSYLWIISSFECAQRREMGEAQLVVTFSKGTNTSSPIILKREAKITSVGITRQLRFFQHSSSSSHWPVWVLIIWCRNATQELCLLVTVNVFSTHFQASANSLPWMKMITHHLSWGLIPIRPPAHHPAPG